MTLHRWLAELERVEKAATPGPFHLERIGFSDDEFAYEIHDGHQLVSFRESNFDSPMKAKFNAEFYCRSRNEFSNLLQIIRIQQHSIDVSHMYAHKDGHLRCDICMDLAKVAKIVGGK